jgi:hypothetical protein
MRADGDYPGRQHTEDEYHRRAGSGGRRARWQYRRATLKLPGCRQRALDRIEQALVSEDPGLCLRFVFFARLTRHETMPGTEQVPGRLQGVLRRVTVLPLLALSLAALLAVCWMIPGTGQPCPASANAAAHHLPSLTHAAGCQRGPAVRLNAMPVH